MKGTVRVRRVLCLVTVCVLAVLMVASVGLAQGLYDKDLPPLPATDPELPPGVGEPPKGGPPKGGPPGDDKELLEAGGDLPSPQESATSPEADSGGRFPLWRVAGIVLSAGVFGFALYRLVHRT
jgi:hypothetical protein